jgi:hypothetical protein
MLLSMKAKDQVIIMPTTNSAYGTGNDNNFCDESKILKPISKYAIDKVAIDSGLTWGGNFPSYVDAVHFEFIPNYVNSPYNQILAQAKAIDPTLVPPFTPSANGLAKCKKIDSLIKQGKIKLRSCITLNTKLKLIFTLMGEILFY